MQAGEVQQDVSPDARTLLLSHLPTALLANVARKAGLALPPALQPPPAPPPLPQQQQQPAMQPVQHGRLSLAREVMARAGSRRGGSLSYQRLITSALHSLVYRSSL
jgi:hypothetical protein